MTAHAKNGDSARHGGDRSACDTLPHDATRVRPMDCVRYYFPHGELLGPDEDEGSLKTRFYILGEITDGVVQKGMMANVWIDGGLYSPQPILAIEFVDFPDGRSLTALQIAHESAEEEELLYELIGDGDTLEIVVPAP